MDRDVRNAPGTSNIIAFTLTVLIAAGDRRDRLRANSRPPPRLDAGFTWHLAKPIEPAELVAAIASLARA